MSRRVVSAVPDLFFAARIAAVARAAGVELVECAPGGALAACREAPTALALIDLEAPGALEAVRALAADPALATLERVGFYPHVRTGLRAAALAAGLTRALTRSALTTLLPALLAGGTAGGLYSAPVHDPTDPEPRDEP
jgi:hypothetical protein